MRHDTLHVLPLDGVLPPLHQASVGGQSSEIYGKVSHWLTANNEQRWRCLERMGLGQNSDVQHRFASTW